jgi:hypothetical protein
MQTQYFKSAWQADRAMHCIKHQEMFAMEKYGNVKRGIRQLRGYITGITSNAQLYEPWSVIFPLTSRALMKVKVVIPIL